MKWAKQYGKWIDWSKDTLRSNGIELENECNKLGLLLTDKVKKALSAKYKVSFSPSSSARMYAGLDF